MAFTQPTVGVINIASEPDRPTRSAADLKALFDKTGADLKTYLIALIAELEAAAAAASLGADALSVSDTSNANIQAKLAYLNTRINAALAGDGAIVTINGTQGDAQGNFDLTSSLVPVVATGFTGVLNNTITTLQLLANAVDALNAAEISTTAPESEPTWTNIQVFLNGIKTLADIGVAASVTAQLYAYKNIGGSF